MTKYKDKLGPIEQGQFMMLAGYHPNTVAVRTHRDALSYLRFIDARRHKRRIEQLALAMRAAPAMNPAEAAQRMQMLQRGQAGQAAPLPGLLGQVLRRVAGSQKSGNS